MTRVKITHEEWELRERELRELIASGLTAREIADRMDVTRNSVCGKANRLGLRIGTGREKKLPALRPRVAAPRQRKAKKSTVVRPKHLRSANPVAPTPVETVERRVRAKKVIDRALLARLSELPAGKCKYPVERGDDGEWLLCGDDRNGYPVYCKEHHEACNYAVEYRKKKR